MFLPYVTETEYLTIVELDHAPILLHLTFPLNNLEHPPWKLDKTLLADYAYCVFISNKTDDFIESNKKDNVSPSILWKTLKAVIRGEIMYSVRSNKIRRQEEDRLIKSIDKVDALYSTSPSPELFKRKLDLQIRFNLLSTKKTERLLLKSHGYAYEHGEKAGRLLACQLKCQAVS